MSNPNPLEARIEARNGPLVFDAEFYLKQYPDLQRAFGPTNYFAALTHWKSSGITEGRRASREFDVNFYMRVNASMGFANRDFVAAIDHWTSIGIGMGLRGSLEFDLSFYLKAYAIKWSTRELALQDWVYDRCFEAGWRGSLEFDPQFYLQTNPDVAKAVGTNYLAGFDHWLAFGLSEGRQSSWQFDVKFYLEKYSDLKDTFGTNYAEATFHWLKYGIAEKRLGAANSVPGYETVVTEVRQPRRRGLRYFTISRDGWKDGEYLLSRNGLYFAIIENGVLSVCKGTGPYDPNRSVYWHGIASNVWKPLNSVNLGYGPGPMAIMQDNGDLQIFEGTNPAVPGPVKWQLPNTALPGYVSPLVHVTQPGPFLLANQYIKQNEYLISSNKQNFTILTDGQLYVYSGSGPNDPNKKILFQTGNTHSSIPHLALMNASGRLGIYEAPTDDLTTIKCVWQTPPWYYGEAFAMMQDDGNFCVYKGRPNASPGGVWCFYSAPPAPPESSGGGGGFWSSFTKTTDILCVIISSGNYKPPAR